MENNEITVGMRFMDLDARRIGRQIKVIGNDHLVGDLRGQAAVLVENDKGKRYLVTRARLLNKSRFEVVVVPGSLAEKPSEPVAA